jgi:hypothetical protein
MTTYFVLLDAWLDFGLFNDAILTAALFVFELRQRTIARSRNCVGSGRDVFKMRHRH